MTTLNHPRMPLPSFGRNAVRLVSVATLLAGIALTGRAQDVSPPTLQSFAFTPAAINVSGGPQAIALAAHVTDDLSGVVTVEVFFRSPTGTQTLNGFLARSTGSAFDGMWTGNIVFPQFSASGTWTVSFVFVSDAAGNSSDIGTAVLVDAGFPTSLLVVSTPDTQAPNVTGISITPGTVDASTADQTLTVNLQVTDDISGVSFTPCVANQPFGSFAFAMQSASGVQSRWVFDAQFTLTAGTKLNGVWTSTVTIPRFSEAGAWRIRSVFVHDCAGNSRSLNDAQLTAAGLQRLVNVVSAPTDVQPPVLTGLSFAPITINTATGNQSVTVRLGITDNLSGADFSYTTPFLTFLDAAVEFRSPSGNQFRLQYGLAFSLVSGTRLNGVWQGTIPFAQFSEEGTWQINLLSIKDATGNVRSYTPAELIAAGFPTTLDVLKPSLVTDAIIGTGGGTVTDQVFGNRASVTFPPGSVTGPTQVAIDVFLNPLQIPTPEGFSGPVTNFVNIQLTPKPHFPLAPPGLTVVLPMANPMVPGTVLNLYKIDTLTGKLVEAIDVSNNPVLGRVNADGLSATFTGISSLSTVVGLLPEPVQVGLAVRTGGSTTIAAGSQFVVNTSATEPADPAAGPWRYILDWGDGTNFTATLTSLPTAARPTARGKVYSTPGTYTVRLTITDKNGLHGSRTLVVTVTP
jgi:hypothetical protein